MDMAGMDLGLEVKEILTVHFPPPFVLDYLPCTCDPSLDKIAEVQNRYCPSVAVFVFNERSVASARRFGHAFRKSLPSCPVLTIGPWQTAAELEAEIADHADDFMIPPVAPASLVFRLQRLLAKVPLLDSTPFALINARIAPERIVGRNSSLAAELQKLMHFAELDGPVLITGETGTGKELCVKALHALSPRSQAELVSVNCGGMSEGLSEAAFFGHVAGAYTSARTGSKGYIREAEGGTLFLDELNSFPITAQSLLLRFLQDHRFTPVGASKPLQANLRVIAATNTNLEELVQKGLFRNDLFQRLAGFRIHLPALRAVPEDIQLLAHYFVEKFATEMKRPVRSLSKDALRKLLHHNWPGNIRELANVVRSAVVSCQKPVIGADQIKCADVPERFEQASFKQAKARWYRDEIHRRLIDANGNVSKAARDAHQDPRVWREMMKRHGISAPSPKPRRPQSSHN